MVKEDIYHYPVPYVVFHGTPNAVYSITDYTDPEGRQVEIKLNELGFRIEKPLAKEKPQNEKRIFFVGSSTIFNGYPLEKTIPGQVEQLFHQNGKINVQVYNFGFVSSVSGQELSLIVHLLSSYDPDAVVVYNGGNDVCLPTNFDPRPGFPYNFFAYESFMKKIRHDINQKGFRWILEGDELQETYKTLQTSHDYATEKWEMNIVTQYIENIVKMERFARGCGFKLYAFLEPVVFLKSPLVEKEKEISTTVYDIPDFHYYLQRQYQRIRQMYEFLKKNEENPFGKFIDLSIIFQGYPYSVYRDFRHVNNEGNHFIAKNIFKSLRYDF